MYDELIKWLRDKETPWNLKDKHDEAADAIEQLIVDNSELTESNNGLRKTIFSNTNREVTLKNRFFVAHQDGFISDENFDFDAGMTVTGDFVDGEKFDYTQMIASALNSVAKADAEIERLKAEVRHLAQLVRNK